MPITALHSHTHDQRPEVYIGLGYDPTRTTGLRQRFSGALSKRFRSLKGIIRKAIIRQDCFGLTRLKGVVGLASKPWEQMAYPTHQQFAFTRTQDKVVGFMDWLKEQENTGILEVTSREQLGRSIDSAWTNKYIRSAYQRGIERGRQEMKNGGHDVRTVRELPGGINYAFNQPFHMDKVGAIYTRTFTELVGVTQAMDQQISRVLTQGLVDGIGPLALAGKLNNRVDKIGIARARTIARTEVIRAHHVATIQEYRNAGVLGIKVLAEWATAGDNRVCPQCAWLSSSTTRYGFGIYDLDTIEGMIPVHPNCRCIALPLDITENKKLLKQVGVESKAEVTTDKDSLLRAEVEKDAVASNFKNTADGVLYLKEKVKIEKALAKIGVREGDFFEAQHSVLGRFITSTVRPEFKRYIKELIPDYSELVKSWGFSTQKRYPSLFKLRAAELEKGLDSVVAKGFTKAELLKPENQSYIEGLSKKYYIRIRALNQVVMENYLGLENGVMPPLYRGIDGRTGRKIADAIKKGLAKQRMRTKWQIKEASLSGYTSGEINVADGYGAAKGGITMRRSNVPISDVIVHRRLLSGLSELYASEEEYILLGGERSLLLDDIKLKDKPFGVITEKAKIPMASIEEKAACVVSGITHNAAVGFFVHKPQACRDYTRSATGKWILQGQEVVGEEATRLNKMGVPPAWTNVVVSKDPTAKVLAIGQDAAGRWQYRYNSDWIKKKAQEKFNRVKLFSRTMPTIDAAVEDGIAAGQHEAFLLRLEQKTAIRAGSRTDFKAKKKAYGLTTLKGSHVTVEGDKIILDFVAKEGIPAHYELTDSTLAHWLRERKAALGSNQDKYLFEEIPADKLNKYLRRVSKGKFSIKDFRTYHGTRIAFEELQAYKEEALAGLTVKRRKAIVKEVSTTVSKFLHNTPVMAKNSYIDPMVWEIIGGAE